MKTEITLITLLDYEGEGSPLVVQRIVAVEPLPVVGAYEYLVVDDVTVEVVSTTRDVSRRLTSANVDRCTKADDEPFRTRADAEAWAKNHGWGAS